MHELTRRRLMAAGTAGIAGAFAGCADSAPSSGDGGDESDGSDDGSSGGETTEPTATTEGPGSEYPDLATATETIVDGIVWHGESYGSVMREVRGYGRGIAALGSDLREADSVTRNDLDRLESRTTAMAEYVRTNVEPHYPVADAVVDGNNVYLQQVNLAAERGDPGGIDSALGRLVDFYGNYGRRSFIEEQFPNGPVHQKLFGRLRHSDGGATAVFGLFHPASDFVTACHRDDEDGVPQHIHEWESGHVVVAHTHEHGDGHSLQDHMNEPRDRTLLAYGDGQFDLLADEDPEDPRLTAYGVERSDVFGPVSLPDERTDVAYVTVNERTETFDQSVVQIQTFETPEGASGAVESMLAADVFAEGTYTLVEGEEDGVDLRRVYYAHEDTTFYTYLLRVGRAVVTFTPSQTEWENRSAWPDEVTMTWLADRTPLEEE
jgi:hypothetical protein